MIDPNIILINWNMYLAGEALTDKTVRPDKVDATIYGDHCSYGDDQGRHWRFKDKEGYSKFIVDYYVNLIMR